MHTYNGTIFMNGMNFNFGIRKAFQKDISKTSVYLQYSAMRIYSMAGMARAMGATLIMVQKMLVKP